MFLNSNAWANIPLTIENCFCKLQVTKSLCEHIFFFGMAMLGDLQLHEHVLTYIKWECKPIHLTGTLA